MKQKRKLLWIAIPLVVVVFAGALYLFVVRSSAPSGMRRVSSYAQGICSANMPECGACPGEIIDGKCYVKKGTYKQYR